MARWTVEQVLALAPDASAAKAARGLARPQPWSETGSTDSLLWGKCQGSGRVPYQITVDLNEPAFHCSCPSRKLPCKHGIALLLMWAAGDGAIDLAAAPAEFAQHWSEQLAGRPSRRSGTAGDEPAPVDPEAQAKRLAERLDKMSAGIDELERWLADLVRHGLANARQQPFSYWDDAAARLVDAQMPGLAERIRLAGGAIQRPTGWIDHLVVELGRWYLAVRAWRRRDELPPALAGDLRAVLGWATPTAEVRGRDVIGDRWVVTGLRREDDGRLQSQRTWLRGSDSDMTAVVLDFAAAGGTLRPAQLVGAVVQADVSRYPGAAPCRVLLPDDAEVVGSAAELPAAVSVGAALDEAAAMIGANPWRQSVPLTLGPVSVVRAGGATHVVDGGGSSLPLSPSFAPWTLLAHSAGAPVRLFGEWDGDTLVPLSMSVDGTLVPL